MWSPAFACIRPPHSDPVVPRSRCRRAGARANQWIAQPTAPPHEARRCAHAGLPVPRRRAHPTRARPRAPGDHHLRGALAGQHRTGGGLGSSALERLTDIHPHRYFVSARALICQRVTMSDGDVDYNPYLPDVQRDPFPHYQQLRKRCPVHRFAIPDADASKVNANPLIARTTTEFYTLSRYADVESALQSHDVFRSWEGPGPDRASWPDGIGMLVFADEPHH